MLKDNVLLEELTEQEIVEVNGAGKKSDPAKCSKAGPITGVPFWLWYSTCF
ncbi:MULTISPECIES: hypothetical protein [Rothia]|jgi:hypothetical protein|uniref:hypothetical protein n=1 Tax=Rothia TaxID=32207 RepID=UPI00143BCD4B|nr:MULTISPECIES: hypothetical protein [Rothia]